MRKLNIGYARVSTTEQAKDGYSLDAQRVFIEKYAKEMKISGLTLFEDEGYSAGNENRPKYKELVNLIRNKKVDNLIIHKIDRLSRNIIDFNTLVSLCIECKVNLVSITDNVNFNSAVGRGTSNIMISIAQMEREQIGERVRDGYAGMLEKGKYPFSKLPFGISKDRDKVISFNEDISIVKEVHSLYLSGMNYCSINREVIKKYPQYSEYFNRHIIERIIRNKLYTGIVEYGGVEYKLVDNIVDDKLINKLSDRSKYIKSIKTMRYYKYYYKIYYLGSRMYPTTSIKRYKDNVKEYPYYRDKSKNVYIAESKLDRILEEGLKYQNVLNKEKVYRKLENLKKMFAMGDISEEQYTEMKKEIKKSKLNLDEVERIEIDEYFNIKVIFVNGQVCDVKYKRGR